VAGYYPQENGERKPLARGDRRHLKQEQRRKFGDIGTRQEREGSAPTQPDVRALQNQVQELLDEKDQFLKNKDKYRRELADQSSTISQMGEDVQGLHKTVAGSGFTLERLMKEAEDGRR